MESIPVLNSGYIQSFYQSLNCPRSLACWILYKNKEFQQLVSLEFNPFDYNSLVDARDSLAATKFLSKADSDLIDTKIDLRSVAIGKFHKAEEQCRLTNSRMLTRRFKFKETEDILIGCIRKIADILGDNDFYAEELIDTCDWGPGATTLMKRRESSKPNKYQSEIGITSAAYDFVRPWFKIAYPLWVRDNKQLADLLTNNPGKGYFEPGCKIVTVPKNAKTDRTIGIEPGINLWFQKGLGGMIRKRLLREGIDLKTQEHNCRLSRLASKFNRLATIDFSAASDTISLRLVEEILPSKWLAALKAFRSSSYVLDGHTHYLEKFSSMGNGYTFELESLIFYSIASACCRYLKLKDPTISVYGDDVIIPSEAVMLYSNVCEDLGFTINKEKSFSSSYYRESCGDHYWFGINIKPLFQKESLATKGAIIKAANGLRRLANRRNCYYGCDASFRKPWLLLTNKLGIDYPIISDGYGDLAIIENIDLSKVSITRSKHGIEGFQVRVWAPLASQRFIDYPGLLSFKLRKSVSEEDLRPDLRSIGNFIPMPHRTRIAKFRISVPRWFDLGPWV